MGVCGTSLHYTTASLHIHAASPQPACLTSKDYALEMWTAGLVAGQRRRQKKDRGCNDGQVEKGLNFTYSPWEGDVHHTSTHFPTPCHDHLSAALLPDAAKALYSERETCSFSSPAKGSVTRNPLCLGKIILQFVKCFSSLTTEALTLDDLSLKAGLEDLGALFQPR